MRYFCTYFDHNYLPKGIALYTSLQGHCANEFQLWVLCLSPECYSTLKSLNLQNLCPIPLSDIEDFDQGLLKVKPTRTTVEYYFTCTPCLPLFLLKQHSGIDVITYLDSDLFFFNSPEPIFQEIGSSSIAIIPHRFSPNHQVLDRYGIYNVGWLSFRNDPNGRDCLEWYRSQCLEWCFDRYEDGKFADQKYLDSWPNQFSGVCVLQHKGANLALWNITNYSVRLTHQGLFVDELPLIFYHFQGIHYDEKLGYRAAISPSDVRAEDWNTVWDEIYVPYMKILHEVTGGLSQYLPTSLLWGSVRSPADMSWLQSLDQTQGESQASVALVSKQPIQRMMDTELVDEVVFLIEKALQQTLPSSHVTHDGSFLNKLATMIQQFCQDPGNQEVIRCLRVLRYQLARSLELVSDQGLPDLYRDSLGEIYRQLLRSGFSRQPLLPWEEEMVNQLGKMLAQGIEKPGGVQALMVVMLYFPPGKMQVRDAVSRIPSWLLSDYQSVFEPPGTVEPTSAPQPIAPPTSATVPLHQDMTFLNRLLGCANLYYIDPEETSIAEELRLIRQQVGQIWAQTPLEQLESLYKSEFGRRYLALLDSGYQNYPLRPEEESVVQELTGLISQGIDRYPGLNALLAIMMYLPPGKMQVRDAANRLPAWLLPDYQRIFEADQATTAPLVPSPQPTVPTAAPAAAAPPAVSQPPNLAEDMVFLNRFLGCSNLYEIDPEDGETVAELRQLRQRVAEFWLTVPPSQLEAVFNSELGRRYGMYLKSGFQREPLTDGERELLVKLAETAARGFEQPGGLNAFLGAMMYYAPGQMQVKDAATRLPGWLFPLYAAVFESEAQKKMTS